MRGDSWIEETGQRVWETKAAEAEDGEESDEQRSAEGLLSSSAVDR